MSNSIKDLTKLGLFFGRISEAHIQNLKNFPFIFFNGVKDFALEHDISLKKEELSLISYRLNLDLNENEYMIKRCRALESAVRSIFWKEVKVEIFVNDKEVYKSE